MAAVKSWEGKLTYSDKSMLVQLPSVLRSFFYTMQSTTLSPIKRADSPVFNFLPPQPLLSLLGRYNLSLLQGVPRDENPQPLAY